MGHIEIHCNLTEHDTSDSVPVWHIFDLPATISDNAVPVSLSIPRSRSFLSNQVGAQVPVEMPVGFDRVENHALFRFERAGRKLLLDDRGTDYSATSMTVKLLEPVSVEGRTP